MRNRISLLGLVALVLAGSPLAPVRASEEGRRNTAYALGAAALYFTIQKQTAPAIIAAGGTAYTTKLLQDDIDARHRRAHLRAERLAYSRGVSAARARTANYARTSSGQSLVSSAYKKGISAGYNSGYRAGLAAGRSAALRNTRPTVQPNISSTYSRIFAVR